MTSNQMRGGGHRTIGACTHCATPRPLMQRIFRPLRTIQVGQFIGLSATVSLVSAVDVVDGCSARLVERFAGSLRPVRRSDAKRAEMRSRVDEMGREISADFGGNYFDATVVLGAANRLGALDALRPVDFCPIGTHSSSRCAGVCLESLAGALHRDRPFATETAAYPFFIDVTLNPEGP